MSVPTKNLKGNNMAIISIISSTLGAGITFMPAAVNAVGLKLYIILMAIICLMTYLSIYQLCYTASFLVIENTDSKKPIDLSYEGIAGKFSRTLKNIVVTAILFSCASTVLSFTQRIVNILISLLTNISFIKENIDPTVLQVSVSIILAISLYFLFCLNDLSSLSIFSNISIVAALLFSVLMVIYNITNTKMVETFYTPEKIEIGKALGYVIFALHSQSCFSI